MPDFSFLKEDDDGEEKPIRIVTDPPRRTKPRKPKAAVSQQDFQNAAGCLVALAFAGAFALCVRNVDVDAVPEDGRILAVVSAQEYIKQFLTAPGSAKFPGFLSGVSIEDHAKKLEDGTYLVDSYVDSQNLFGAFVRVRFSVRIELLRGGRYRIIEGGVIE
jgi:hypothetical protein